MLDYAHNKSGYKEVINACKGIEHKRLIGVIGMPGDRTDHAISEVGALCAGSFDKIYIKEDKALRGRQKEEVALILKEAVINSGFPEDKVYTIPCEEEALKAAAKEADRGDLIVGFYEDFEPLDRLISKSLLH